MEHDRRSLRDGYVGILEQRNDRGFFRDHTPRHPGDRVEYDFDTGGGAVAGMSPWILEDFRAPVRVLPGIQDGYNRKGLVNEEGEPKLAFHVLSSMYASTDRR